MGNYRVIDSIIKLRKIPTYFNEEIQQLETNSQNLPKLSSQPDNIN